MSREAARDAVPEFSARVARLLPLTECGPQFNRGVRDELGAAYRSWQPEGVGMFLVAAEVAAGFRDRSDYPHRDSPLVWSTIPAGTISNA